MSAAVVGAIISLRVFGLFAREQGHAQVRSQSDDRHQRRVGVTTQFLSAARSAPRDSDAEQQRGGGQSQRQGAPDKRPQLDACTSQVRDRGQRHVDVACVDLAWATWNGSPRAGSHIWRRS